MRYKLYDVQLAIGGLVKTDGKPRDLASTDGKPMPATVREVLLHDLLVWGLNSALLLLRGKKPKVKPVKMTELQKRMRGIGVSNPGKPKSEWPATKSTTNEGEATSNGVEVTSTPSAAKEHPKVHLPSAGPAGEEP
jgi:hypothetical protein